MMAAAVEKQGLAEFYLDDLSSGQKIRELGFGIEGAELQDQDSRHPRLSAHSERKVRNWGQTAGRTGTPLLALAGVRSSEDSAGGGRSLLFILRQQQEGRPNMKTAAGKRR